jgi:hypothetical protein
MVSPTAPTGPGLAPLSGVAGKPDWVGSGDAEVGVGSGEGVGEGAS